MTFFDTHAHLDDAKFADDLPGLLDRAAVAGVKVILSVGVDYSTSRAAVLLAEKYHGVYAVVGIQPNHVSEASASDWDEIARLSVHPQVLAIGETGLDRYWDRAPMPMQEEYFVRHLALARSLGKPVVIHCREAEADVVRVLRNEYAKYGPIRGVMHSFSGDLATAKACWDMGLHLSFAGMVTYKSASNLREVARNVPDDRLLIETDSPYLAPVPVRGRRNEPAHVVHTAKSLADARGVPLEVLASQTTRNARGLFSVSSPD